MEHLLDSARRHAVAIPTLINCSAYTRVKLCMLDLRLPGAPDRITCMLRLVTTMQVGHGKAAFERAKDALSRWEHFQLGWALVDPDTPVKEDTRVCVESKPVPFLPIWTACPLRIVYAPLRCHSLVSRCDFCASRTPRTAWLRNVLGTPGFGLILFPRPYATSTKV